MTVEKSDKVFLSGSSGMLGSSIYEILKSEGYSNIIKPRSKELNLISQESVSNFFSKERPDYVILCAAKVGGIYANMTYKADFCYENLMIEANVIHNASKYGAKRLIFISSGCVYPRDAENPIKEESLLGGRLEPSNEHYAISKIAGIKMCEAYHDQYGLSYGVIVPNNIYGPKDNYHLKNSHVTAALIRKFHEAKVAKSPNVEVWGSGNQKREVVYVDDVASACVKLMESDKNIMCNVGSGKEVSIKELALAVKKAVGYEGEIVFNTSKPEGFPRKFFDSSKANSIGWKSEIDLEDGLKKAYECFKSGYRSS